MRIALCLIALTGCAPQSGPDLPLGDAPDFEIPLARGGTFRLSDHAGEVVLIDMSLYICSTCQALADDTEELANTYKDQGLTVITALKAPNDAAVDDWVESFHLTHSVARDLDREVWNKYREGDIRPQFAVVDQHQDVVFLGTGTVGHADAEQAILDLL